MPGRFITFEGIDGAGKSTHIEAVAAHLREGGRAVVSTREPGGTQLAEALRYLVLHAPMDSLTETLLIFAARRDHVANLIAPSMARGDVVLCDRFTDATEAYQGAGRGVDGNWIRALAGIAHPGLDPDLTIVFDVPATVANERLALRGARQDRIEAEDAGFFQRVRTAYLDIAVREPGRVRVVDATRPEADVAASVAALLDAALAAEPR